MNLSVQINCHPLYNAHSPITVIVILIIASKRAEVSKTYGVRVKDLSPSIHPYLTKTERAIQFRKSNIKNRIAKTKRKKLDG